MAVGCAELSNGFSLLGTVCQHLPLCQVQKRPGNSSHPAVLPEPEELTGKAQRPGCSADSLGGGASSR